MGFEVVRKNREYLDPVTGKRKRRAERSQNEIFRDRVWISWAHRLKFQYVVADSGYASQENRTVALSEKDQREGKFQPISPAPLENHALVRGSIRGLEYPVRLVKQVFTNHDGSTGVVFLAGCDLSWDGEPMVEIYPKRWRMEVYHKSIQLNLGLE